MNTSPVSRPALCAGASVSRLLRRLVATAALVFSSSRALAQTPQHYETVYDNSLGGLWLDASWGTTTNFSADPRGRTGQAIEARIDGGWNTFSLMEDWHAPTNNFFNECLRIEFEIYVESDSQNSASLEFSLWDADGSPLALPNFIAGWSTMTDAQRYGRWHHVSLNLASLNPAAAGFKRIAWRDVSGSGGQHFRLAAIRLGWSDDLTPPTATLGTPALDYDQLTLPFSTNEGTNFRVEYGYGNYNSTFDGTDDWGTSHTAVLNNLTLGATLQYRIVAMHHRNDPAATPGQAVLTGTYFIVDPPPPTTPTITITANPAAAHPISPWIYGLNPDPANVGLRNIPLTRSGGNRLTAYNWETNASNAGKDWLYQNDDYLGGGEVPAEVIRPNVVENRAAGRATIVSLQMQGYVAGDKAGPVSLTDPARFTTRLKQVVSKKPSAFTLAPSTTDASVYMDEFLWNLDRRVTNSTAGGTATTIYTDAVAPVFLSLDNEPELWHDTHPEIQGSTLVTPATLIAKSIALSRAIKDLAPAATTFGPVNYGFMGVYNWQESAGFSSSYWFVDRYLSEMQAASQTYGRRLLDVYDFHWYPETYPAPGTRINWLDSSDLSPAQIQAIVQNPRSFWDPTFVEPDNWIVSTLGNQPIRIVSRIKEKIAALSPGTEVAITEYNSGGYNHIAGAIAQADNLGVFGQHGVFAATLWPERDGPFIYSGFKMYRDFDGNLGEFGDISIPTSSSDTSKVAAYLSRDSANPNRQVIVALNRSSAPQAVAFTGAALSGSARIFRLSGTRTTPVQVGTATVDADWLLSLPPYCVVTVEILGGAPPATYATWRATAFPEPNVSNDAIAGPNADPDGAGVTNFQRYAFGLAARGPVAPPTTLGSVDSAGQSYLTILFGRRASGSDLSYIVEASTDLVTWTPVTGQTYAPGTPATVTAQDSVAIGTATRRFLRVRLASP